jgi:hypothetical protein
LASKWTADGVGLRIEGLALPMGLRLDEAVVSGTDVAVSSDPFSITLGEDASATVRVSCDSVREFLSTLGLRDLTVETRDGLLVASGTVVVLVPIRATAYCRLVVVDGARLEVELERADPAAAASLIARQLGAVNPLLDLGSLPINLEITDVSVEDGWVTISGRASKG